MGGVYLLICLESKCYKQGGFALGIVYLPWKSTLWPDDEIMVREMEVSKSLEDQPVCLLQKQILKVVRIRPLKSLFPLKITINVRYKKSRFVRSKQILQVGRIYPPVCLECKLFKWWVLVLVCSLENQH